MAIFKVYGFIINKYLLNAFIRQIKHKKL